MNGGRSGPRSFDRQFQAMWIIWEQTQKGGLLLRTQHDRPHRAAVDAFDAGQQFRLGCQSAAAVVAHTGEEIAERHGALTLGAVRLVRAFSA